MAYATIEDVQKRLLKELSDEEKSVCEALLDDAALLIDAYKKDAELEAKKVVSCRMIIRAINTGDTDTPIGATQGSVSALGYSQSWTISSGGEVGQLYLDKTDKKFLGGGSKIGAYSPLEDLVKI